MLVPGPKVFPEAPPTAAPTPFNAKCLLIGCSIALNLAIVLVAVAAAGVAYGSRLAPVITSPPAVFDDLGTCLPMILTTCALAALLHTILPPVCSGIHAAARRLIPRPGRVCPLIPPSGRFSTPTSLSPRYTVHSHRRHAASHLLKENLRELGPIWLTLFFGVEWLVSALLDSSCSRLGLALHAHALPRQAQLLNRWRTGACRRCAFDTADALQRCAAATIFGARLAYAVHGLGCTTVALHAWRLLRWARRRLSTPIWLALVTVDLVWMEAEWLLRCWLTQHWLRTASQAIYAGALRASRAVPRVNMGGALLRLSRRAWRTLRRAMRQTAHQSTVPPPDAERHSGSRLWGSVRRDSDVTPDAPPASAGPARPAQTGHARLSRKRDQAANSQLQSQEKAYNRAPGKPALLTPVSPGACHRATGKPASLTPVSPGACQLQSQAKAYDRVRARAALSAPTTGRKAPTWRSLLNVIQLSIILDSGCTWHSHPNAEDLINLRPCNERIACADGVEHACSGIGDLPLLAKDGSGKEHMVLLRDVRCVPTFTDTLISIEHSFGRRHAST